MKRRSEGLELSLLDDVDTGRPPMACQISNVSKFGAKVICEAPAQIPDEFNLFMTADRSVVRESRVAWRTENAIGLIICEAVPGHKEPAPPN